MSDYQHVFISLPEDLGEEIEARVDFSVQNDGIGSYEYWGFKGYDAGTDYIEVEDVTPLFKDEPEELRTAILNYIDTHTDAVWEDAEQRLTFENDYDDGE